MQNQLPSDEPSVPYSASDPLLKRLQSLEQEKVLVDLYVIKAFFNGDVTRLLHALVQFQRHATCVPIAAIVVGAMQEAESKSTALAVIRIMKAAGLFKVYDSKAQTVVIDTSWPDAVWEEHISAIRMRPEFFTNAQRATHFLATGDCTNLFDGVDATVTKGLHKRMVDVSNEITAIIAA